MLTLKHNKMKIQDTINELGLEQESLPRILNQRINSVKELIKNLETAREEYNDNPSPESEEKLSEVEDYVKEYFNDVEQQLRTYKSKQDEKLNNQKPKEDEKTKVAEPNDDNKEKKKDNGLAGLLIGGVVLVATLGAVNILNKN